MSKQTFLHLQNFIRILSSNPLSKPRSEDHNFVPTRMIVADPSREYCKIVWCSLWAGLTNVLIGAVNMTVILYSISSSDPHVALCTLAYQFFTAEAILSLNYFNGWPKLIIVRHRKLAHVLLQICALICAIAGTVLVFIQREWTGSLHGITGLTTAALSGFSFLSGPFALFDGPYMKTFHTFMGVPTFLMSSVSLCFAFYMTDFKTWVDSVTHSALTAFVIFYTIYIVVYLFIKLFHLLK